MKNTCEDFQFSRFVSLLTTTLQKLELLPVKMQYSFFVEDVPVTASTDQLMEEYET